MNNSIHFKENRINLILAGAGFYALALFFILYAIFTRTFAHLHLTLRGLDLPIFVGEMLLAFCLLIGAILFLRNPPPFNRWQVTLGFYLAFVIWKTVYGLLFYQPGEISPLALRNAALFYYPLFAVLAYLFCRKEFFHPKLVLLYLVILLSIKFFFSINNYFVYPFLALGMMCLAAIRKEWAWWLLVIPVLYVPSYYFDPKTFTNLDFFFQGGRGRVLGHLAAFCFLAAGLTIFLPPFKRIQRISILIMVLLVVGFGIFSFSDRNSVKSMVLFSEGKKRYNDFREYVDREGRNYQPKPLAPKIYSQEDLGFKESVTVFVKAEYSKEAPKIQERISAVQEIAFNIEKEKIKVVNDLVTKAEEQKQNEVEKISRSIEENKEKAISQARSESQDPVNLEANIQKIESHFEQLSSEKTQAVEEKVKGEMNFKIDEIRKKRIKDINTAIDELDLNNMVTIPQLLNDIEDADGQNRTLDVAFTTMFFRLFIWEDMMKELFTQKAILGLSFAHPQRSRSLEILGWASREWIRDGWITPHNSYLHMIYRGGIIGVLLIMAMGIAFYKTTKTFLRAKSAVGLILASLLVYWMVISHFLVFLEFPYNAIPFWSVFGITAALAKSLSEEPAFVSKTPSQRILEKVG